MTERERKRGVGEGEGVVRRLRGRVRVDHIVTVAIDHDAAATIDLIDCCSLLNIGNSLLQ